MRTLIGSATGFSSGGPGKGMYCRAVTQLLQKNNYIDSASVISNHFTDSGLFGINLQGPGAYSINLLEAAMETLSNLRDPVSPSELQRAKNIVKMNIILSMETQENRLEEMARNY